MFIALEALASGQTTLARVAARLWTAPILQLTLVAAPATARALAQTLTVRVRAGRAVLDRARRVAVAGRAADAAMEMPIGLRALVALTSDDVRQTAAHARHWVAVGRRVAFRAQRVAVACYRSENEQTYAVIF